MWPLANFPQIVEATWIGGDIFMLCGICRLFLSMDPVHGELSRAMRNRGVEVYIPGEHEGVCWDTLDLKTLLHTAGVRGDCVCDLLMEIQKNIKSAIWGKHNIDKT